MAKVWRFADVQVLAPLFQALVYTLAFHKVNQGNSYSLAERNNMVDINLLYVSTVKVRGECYVY